MPNAKDNNIDFVNCKCAFTSEALMYLSKKTKGVTYYDIFITILQAMVTTTTTLKSGWREVTLQPGQVAISNEVLTKKFGFDPKTMKGIVNRMAELDLFRIHRTTTTTIIDVVFLAGWYANGRYVNNPLYLHARPTATASAVQCAVSSQASVQEQAQQPTEGTLGAL